MIKKILILTMLLLNLAVLTTFAAENEKNESHKHISVGYDYSIMCPQTPKYLPAEVFFGDNTKKGDLLVFDFAKTEDGSYDIKRGWLILVNAFNSTAVPDFNKDSKEVIDKYLKDLQKQGYEGTALVNITPNNKGVLAVTAKEIEVDEDGDGKPDAMLVTDRQEVITFFRMPDGRCFSAQLIGSNELTEGAINNFRKALATIAPYNFSNPNANNKDKKDKKAKKDKKDKKSKKDKKN